MTTEEIKSALESHCLWLINDPQGIRAYLSRADLSGADLSGTDLSGTDLSKADLSRADLSRADLSGVALTLAGYDEIWLCGDGSNVLGFKDDLPLRDKSNLRKWMGAKRRKSKSTDPGTGLRNQHTFSGRIE